MAKKQPSYAQLVRDVVQAAPEPLTVAEIMASNTDIRPDGTGRFFVRSISASRLRSITWLNALLAPTTRKPPIIKAAKTDPENVPGANK